MLIGGPEHWASTSSPGQQPSSCRRFPRILYRRGRRLGRSSPSVTGRREAFGLIEAPDAGQTFIVASDIRGHPRLIRHS